MRSSRSNNIGMFFISSIPYSTKVNPASIQQLNGLRFDECTRNRFKFADNGAISETDLWIDGIHMIESGKRIIANNLINSLSFFSEFMNPVTWYLLSENTLSSEKTNTSNLNSEKLYNSEINLTY